MSKPEVKYDEQDYRIVNTWDVMFNDWDVFHIWGHYDVPSGRLHHMGIEYPHNGMRYVPSVRGGSDEGEVRHEFMTFRMAKGGGIIVIKKIGDAWFDDERIRGGLPERVLFKK